MSFLSNLWTIIKRNPLTTILLLVLLVGAPQVLGLFALVLLVPIVTAVVWYLVFMWRLSRAQRDVEEQFRSHRTSHTSHTHAPREGDVTITRTEPSNKRVSDEVGEYVDFKDVEK